MGIRQSEKVRNATIRKITKIENVKFIHNKKTQMELAKSRSGAKTLLLSKKQEKDSLEDGKTK